MLRIKHIYADVTNDFEMFNAYLSSDDVFENELDTIIVRDGKFYNIYFLDEERWVYDDDERPENLNDCINAAMQELMDREVTFKFGETMETLEKEAEEYEARNRKRESNEEDGKAAKREFVYEEFCEKHVRPNFVKYDPFEQLYEDPKTAVEKERDEYRYKEFCEKHVKPYFFDDDEFYGQSDS